MTSNPILVVIAVGALVAILVPLFRGGTRRGRGAVQKREETPGTDLPDEVTELELDHAMGRLSDADYQEFLEHPGRKVESEPLPMSGQSPGSGAGEGALLVSGRVDLEARAGEMIRRAAAIPRPDCPRCGERPEPGARFCSGCGSRLATCGACGHRLDVAGARFCPACGRALTA